MPPILKVIPLVLYLYTFIDVSSGQYSSGTMMDPKYGACPPPLPRLVCSNTCRNDIQCPGTQKCCPTSCGGTICSRSVTPRRNPDLVKRGVCPAVDEGPWFCSSTCISDSDCRGNMKCCRNRCGAMACFIPSN